MCVEWPRAAGKALRRGWDVSAHHWVLYKELGLACEAGLESWGCTYCCPLLRSSPATSLIPGYPVASKTCTLKEWPAKDSAEWWLMAEGDVSRGN